MRPIHSLDVGGLQDYVRSIANLPKFSDDLPKGAYPFITISRQAGAGGHTLAEAVLEEMEKSAHPALRGWKILDQELCRQVSEDPKLKVSMEWLLTERFQRGLEDYLSQVLAGASPQITVFHKIARLVRTLAVLGKVIVVGRAGSFLTRDLPLGIHVRLVAAKASRVQRMMLQFNFNQPQAQRQVEEQDADRALLVSTYFNGKNINDPQHYDMVWNTDSIPIPTIAAVLAGLAKEKANRGAELRAEARLATASRSKE